MAKKPREKILRGPEDLRMHTFDGVSVSARKDGPCELSIAIDAHDPSRVRG